MVKSFLVTAIVIIWVILADRHPCEAMTRMEKRELRDKASEMFHHAYRSYMDYAYPADELMPLSCKGRYRGTHPSRGDIDDALGNFSLTLIDTLDTLAVLGEVEEFEKAVRLVINDIVFDNDIVVSVFETNIRVIGGLLGGHLMSDFLKRKLSRMLWYSDELLTMARDLGDRLLPAFNTSTGIPYPRVNLRYGVKHEMSRTGSEKDTCTACAGTMLLEFSALSRLTGNTIYEEKASRAMDYLWESRHRASDLVGTVINIHNGDWVRRESGIGAGIDSYYEYLLKGYIMLGKDTYLDRFNKHYKAVMKYVSNGPLMLDVHMHRPQMNSRNFMDSLLAFWPGLQVLKGDLKSAIEIHEMLYQVTLRHNFLPEAFTTDFRVHWAQHPLRPEFLESTYFIYKATGDPYYLEVGKSVIENLDRHARVACGFAAIKDVTTGTHEDQMDSYVLAETFKYLFLLFSEKEDLILNVDDYVFTTEAHLLPLFLSLPSGTYNRTEESERLTDGERNDADDEELDHNTCPSTSHLFKGKIDFAHHLRSPLKNMVENLCPKPKSSEARRLRATEFMAGNKDQLTLLNRMGIRIVTMSDGRVQLLHLSNEAASPEDSAEGLLFMQEMIELSKAQTNDASLEPRVVQLMSPPFFGSVVLKAGPAQFGVNLKNHPGIEGQLAIAEPIRGCQPLSNQAEVSGKFVMVERGDCMFVDKARHLQTAGAIGGIIFDNNSQSSADSSPLFSMSGDGKADIIIPLVFLFHSEAKVLQEALVNNPHLVVYVSERLKKSDDVLLQYLSHKSHSLAVAPPIAGGSSEGGSGSENEEDAGAADSASASASEMEKAAKELILVLLRRIRLETLEPFIRRRSRDGREASGSAGSGGAAAAAFQVRVIRMPEDATGERVRMEMPNEEEGQRVVRVVFTEFLLLLMECTNLARLAELGQVMDALARLTESVFTGGRMAYGVHTETLVDGLAGRIVVSEECSVAAFPAVPEVRASTRGGKIEEIEEGAEGARVTVTESQELRKFVSEFVEDQLGLLVKELMVAGSGEASESSTVEVVFTAGPFAHEGTAQGGETAAEAADSDGGLLFLNGYRLDDADRLDEIKRRINVMSAASSEEGPSAASRDAATVCDDEDGATVTDAPVAVEPGGLTWKLREGCWSVDGTGSAEDLEGKADESREGKSGGEFRWRSDTLRPFALDEESSSSSLVDSEHLKSTFRDIIDDLEVPSDEEPSSDLGEHDRNEAPESFYENPASAEENLDADGRDPDSGGPSEFQDEDQQSTNDRVAPDREAADRGDPETVRERKTDSDGAAEGANSIESERENEEIEGGEDQDETISQNEEIEGATDRDGSTSRNEEIEGATDRDETPSRNEEIEGATDRDETLSRNEETDSEPIHRSSGSHSTDAFDPDDNADHQTPDASLESLFPDNSNFPSDVDVEERTPDAATGHPTPSTQTTGDQESIVEGQRSTTTNPDPSNPRDHSVDGSRRLSSSCDAENPPFTSEESASAVRADSESPPSDDTPRTSN